MSEETTPVADPMEAVGSAMREMVTAIREQNTALIEEVRALRPTPEPERDPSLLPGGRGIDPTDTMSDRFDQLGYVRADYEIAGMLFGGSVRQNRATPWPEDFSRAWKHHLFETGRRIMVNEAGKLRAMDTAESGFGQQLVGTAYESALWEAARAADPLLASIREIPMAASTQYVPIDGVLPEMLFVAENTANNSSAYTTSKTPSNRATLTAKKFTIQSMWSGELDQDSIISFAPFIREKMQQSAAFFLGSAYYNGDDTNAASGNINLDDADPVDTRHFLAWDGIRHVWLVDNTANGKDMSAALDIMEILRARGKLNAITDDIDDAPSNINWGANVNDLLLVADFDTYMNLLNNDAFVTVDKYGANAPVLTGELGRVFGIRVVSPPYAGKTDVDGKQSESEASNSKGQISVFNTRGFLAGNRSGVEMFFDRVQGRDQYLLELYTRRAFTRHGTGVAAGIYDITV